MLTQTRITEEDFPVVYGRLKHEQEGGEGRLFAVYYFSAQCPFFGETHTHIVKRHIFQSGKQLDLSPCRDSKQRGLYLLRRPSERKNHE